MTEDISTSTYSRCTRLLRSGIDRSIPLVELALRLINAVMPRHAKDVKLLDRDPMKYIFMVGLHMIMSKFCFVVFDVMTVPLQISSSISYANQQLLMKIIRLLVYGWYTHRRLITVSPRLVEE